MTPAQRSDADELSPTACKAPDGPLVSSDDQTPEHFDGAVSCAADDIEAGRL
jgi:hypothetical protein